MEVLLAIEVTLLLAGGHSRTVWLDPVRSTLQELLAALARKATGGVGGAHNITFDEGNKSLLFSGTDLVAIITSPALQLVSPDSDAVQHRLPDKPCCHIVPGFLDEAELKSLLKMVEYRVGDFAPSCVEQTGSDIRHSSVLYNLGQFRELFEKKILCLFPVILSSLGLQPMSISEFECQITAHGNAGAFGLHCDLTSDEFLVGGQRTVSFAYYFHVEPRQFSGGQLRISNFEPGKETDETLAVLEPRNNTIVFFPSTLYHEVMPVVCSTLSFLDGRFSVNGWIRCT